MDYHELMNIFDEGLEAMEKRQDEMQKKVELEFLKQNTTRRKAINLLSRGILGATLNKGQAHSSSPFGSVLAKFRVSFFLSKRKAYQKEALRTEKEAKRAFLIAKTRNTRKVEWAKNRWIPM